MASQASFSLSDADQSCITKPLAAIKTGKEERINDRSRDNKGEGVIYKFMCIMNTAYTSIFHLDNPSTLCRLLFTQSIHEWTTQAAAFDKDPLKMCGSCVSTWQPASLLSV